MDHITQTEKKLPERHEIPLSFTWRLEDIFATDEKWEQVFKKMKLSLPQLAEFKGKLHESANTLLKALQLRDQYLETVKQLYTYAHMRHDQDVTNSFYQAMNERAISLYMETVRFISFFDPEILAMKQQKIESFLESNPELQLYKHELAKLNRRRPHVLSEKEESLLVQASEVMMAPGNIYGSLNNADLKFPTIVDEDGDQVEITHGRYLHFMESRDPRVRKDAFHAVYNTYKQFRNTFANTLNGAVKKNNFIARARNYDSARQAALSGNDIPETVYDQLIETVNRHIPLLQRYIKLKKQVLNQEELHMYDIYAPLIDAGKISMTYPTAQEKLREALRPLGDEYLQILEKAFNERWIDVYENKGKRSGAYSSGVYGTNPYILLNWQGDVIDLFTLAHEFGHSAHSYYSRTNQPFTYGDYTIFVAEVASTCNEALLLHYLLQTTDDPKLRLYLINHSLEGFRATVFRQTMFAEFEYAIHQMAQNGEALTPDQLTNNYHELNNKYFGKEVIVDPLIGYEWARIPHFYYNFYVYQYATGYSAAAALSQQIIDEGKPAVKRYLDFLKAGSSDYPIEVLKKAGVDMTSSSPIEQAFQIFSRNLNEMERLLIVNTKNEGY
ncbi:oligopeptidase F. Metallo peptidase. MEROPS family M03B [Seinonella peptonophila]|uniref:Oligopeptidase F n=1 Tax=Seinonella peptonophila TaxID=112248 RepID=A0A1M4SZB0_9BACL|nr:oligoendopeptidase F [Seinonella peptonophila]SHE37562.1 oligopeptidase F. Metallo peptidase. MEROPS family M03B [Seinonella peptonophila]